MRPAAGESKVTNRGVVSIIGAGPGDPELITVKALKRIQAADVILYDRLVGDALLAEARENCPLHLLRQSPRSSFHESGDDRTYTRLPCC
nr:SAM-dependent methyltransferase [Paenibacillus silvae]